MKAYEGQFLNEDCRAKFPVSVPVNVGAQEAHYSPFPQGDSTAMNRMRQKFLSKEELDQSLVQPEEVHPVGAKLEKSLYETLTMQKLGKLKRMNMEAEASMTGTV